MTSGELQRATGPDARVLTRRAVRIALARLAAAAPAEAQDPAPDQAQDAAPDQALPLVLVALSGGADSLALASATAREAARARVRAGAVVVDHGLQDGSAAVAESAAAQARALGLDPVLIRRADVARDSADGPEAAARTARYAELAAAASDSGAAAILTAHTRDDQAEQVLLGIARGSGLRSLAGIPSERGLRGGASVAAPGAASDRRPRVRILRPFLAEETGIGRAETLEACAADGLTPWSDPHNADPAFARVRVRATVLPVLERELGPGIAAALARTADLAGEDAAALELLAERALAELGGGAGSGEAGAAVSLPVARLAEQPAAILYRMIRQFVSERFGSRLSREHTLGIAALVTDWRGQGPAFVPGIRVHRAGGEIVFERQLGSPRRLQ